MKKNLELVQLEICHRRKALLTDKMKSRYKSNGRGFEGEDEAYNWVFRYGSSKWYVIYDYWFAKGNLAQIDLMIITKNTWNLLEVKNYDGHVRYENDSCYLNDYLISDNPMTSMAIKLQKIKQIAAELSYPVTVEGAMIFINQHSSLDLDQSFPFELLTRNQFRHYLLTIKNKPQQTLTDKELQRVERLLDKYRALSPFGPYDLPLTSFDQLEKGITCAACHSWETRVGYQKVYCLHCQASEGKKQAIVRTARDLRYLFYYQPDFISSRRLYQFMGGQISLQSIRKVMKTTFGYRRSSVARYYPVGLD